MGFCCHSLSRLKTFALLFPLLTLEITYPSLPQPSLYFLIQSYFYLIRVSCAVTYCSNIQFLDSKQKLRLFVLKGSRRRSVFLVQFRERCGCVPRVIDPQPGGSTKCVMSRWACSLKVTNKRVMFVSKLQDSGFNYTDMPSTARWPL